MSHENKPPIGNSVSKGVFFRAADRNIIKNNMVGNWLKRWFLKKVSRKVSFISVDDEALIKFRLLKPKRYSYVDPEKQ